MLAGMNTEAPPRGPLRRLRKNLMLTQEDLARLSGVHRTTIIRLEQEPDGAYDQTIIKLASALGLDPLELRDMMLKESE
jgi:DNA-binding XRE family transcriptional regulator